MLLQRLGCSTAVGTTSRSTPATVSATARHSPFTPPPLYNTPRDPRTTAPPCRSDVSVQTHPFVPSLERVDRESTLSHGLHLPPCTPNRVEWIFHSSFRAGQGYFHTDPPRFVPKWTKSSEQQTFGTQATNLRPCAMWSFRGTLQVRDHDGRRRHSCFGSKSAWQR